MSMTPSSTQYFETNARQWDSLRSGYFDDAIREAAIRRAYLRPEMTVADIGTGTGFLAAALAPLVQQVYAIDGSEPMLKVAHENLQSVNNIEFRSADATRLPLPDSSVDAVFANMLLHHIPEPIDAIREMVRILRPGGRLIITDLDEHPYAWLKEEMADVWQGFDRRQVRAWFEQAGLVNILVDCTGESCCAESSSVTDEQDRNAKISVFVAVGAKGVAGAGEKVQIHYDSLAQSGKTSCCETSSIVSSCCEPSSASSSCCGTAEQSLGAADDAIQIGYTPEDLAAIPQESANFSLGCGNPVAMAGLKPGERVLDIGSGGGVDVFLAAKRVGPEGRAIGVDRTPSMLARARQTAKKFGLENVEFRKGTAEALPIEDESVDVILSNCVINLTPDKGRTFREAFRVLAPGGRLEISDTVTDTSFPTELRSDPANWGSCIYGALPEEEYLALIRQAGFDQVTVKNRVSAGENHSVKLSSLIISAVKPVEKTKSTCGCS